MQLSVPFKVDLHANREEARTGDPGETHRGLRCVLQRSQNLRDPEKGRNDPPGVRVPRRALHQRALLLGDDAAQGVHRGEGHLVHAFACDEFLRDVRKSTHGALLEALQRHVGEDGKHVPGRIGAERGVIRQRQRAEQEVCRDDVAEERALRVAGELGGDHDEAVRVAEQFPRIERVQQFGVFAEDDELPVDGVAEDPAGAVQTRHGVSDGGRRRVTNFPDRDAAEVDVGVVALVTGILEVERQRRPRAKRMKRVKRGDNRRRGVTGVRRAHLGARRSLRATAARAMSTGQTRRVAHWDSRSLERSLQLLAPERGLGNQRASVAEQTVEKRHAPALHYRREREDGFAANLLVRQAARRERLQPRRQRLRLGRGVAEKREQKLSARDPVTPRPLEGVESRVVVLRPRVRGLFVLQVVGLGFLVGFRERVDDRFSPLGHEGDVRLALRFLVHQVLFEQLQELEIRLGDRAVLFRIRRATFAFYERPEEFDVQKRISV